MPQFQFRRHLEMPARPDRAYATVYIKQTAPQHQALLAWLTDTAQAVVQACDQDPDLAQWFAAPDRRFRRSQQGHYYSPQDILADMIQQMSLGRDLTQAMLSRWNRLVGHTPWQIDLTLEAGAPEIGPRAASAPIGLS